VHAWIATAIIDRPWQIDSLAGTSSSGGQDSGHGGNNERSNLTVLLLPLRPGHRRTLPTGNRWPGSHRIVHPPQGKEGKSTKRSKRAFKAVRYSFPFPCTVEYYAFLAATVRTGHEEYTVSFTQSLGYQLHRRRISLSFIPLREIPAKLARRALVKILFV